MSNMQLLANYGIIDQASADQMKSKGVIEQIRGKAKTLAAEIADNMGVGAGSPEHQACMRKVDHYLNELERNLQTQAGTTANIGNEFHAVGNKMTKMAANPAQSV